MPRYTHDTAGQVYRDGDLYLQLALSVPPRERADAAKAVAHALNQLGADAALAQDEFVFAPALETLRKPVVVKRPTAEMAPPGIGEHGGISIGAHHMRTAGAVMSIALHHPDGMTLMGTFGYEGYAELAHAFNRWGERISAGEFNKPPVAS